MCMSLRSTDMAYGEGISKHSGRCVLMSVRIMCVYDDVGQRYLEC